MEPIAISKTQSRIYLWDGKNYYTQVVAIPEAGWPDTRTLPKSPDQYAPCHLVKSLPPYHPLPSEKPVLWTGALDKHLPTGLLASRPLPRRGK